MSVRPQDSQGYMGPMFGAVAVTKSDSTEYDPPLRGLYVGGTGDVRVIFANADADDVTFTALAAGVVHPIANIKKVMSTDTTATAIVGGR